MAWKDAAEEDSVDLQTESPTFTGALSAAESYARSVNRGLVSSVPGGKWLANKIGVGLDEPDGDTALTSGLEMAGLGVGMVTQGVIAPARAAAASALEQLTSKVQISQEVLSGFVPAVRSFIDDAYTALLTKPGSFVGLEVTSGVSAGAAGFAAEQRYDDPSVKLAAEIIGGGVPAVASSALRTVRDAHWAAIAARSVVGAVRGGSEAARAGSARAVARFHRATPDPSRAARLSESTDVIPEARLTVGEKSEDVGLLSLEKSVWESTDTLKRENAERFTEINQVIRGELEGLSGEANPHAAREYLDSLLSERIRLATAQYEERVVSLAPTLGREQASRLAKQELDSSLVDARAQETELWEAIDVEVPATVARTLESYESTAVKLWENRVTRKSTKLPKRITNFIGSVTKEGKFKAGELANGATLGEVRSLRNLALREIRVEQATGAPDHDKVRMLNEIQDVLLEDMSGISGNEALDLARGFSADLNTRFFKTSVGQHFGHKASGQLAVPEMVTLEKGRFSGLEGGQRVDDLLGASTRKDAALGIKRDSSKEMEQYISDYLADSFVSASRKGLGGDFNAVGAVNFVRTHREALGRLPVLNKRITEAIEAGSEIGVARSMTDPKVSPAAVILGKNPGKEVEALIGNTNPAKAAKELRLELSKDPMGKALPSMRTAVVDWLFSKSLRSDADLRDDLVVHGKELGRLLADPSAAAVVKEFLTADQLTRLARIKNTALRYQRTIRGSLEGVMGDSEGMIVNVVRRVSAAAVGHRVAQITGGGPIQTTSLVIGFSDKLRKLGVDPARKLMVDAVTSADDTLYKALLAQAPSQEVAKIHARRLHAWMLAVAAEYGISLAEE